MADNGRRPDRDYLRCAHCGTPWAEIQGEFLVHIGRHHGQQHVTVVSIAELARRAGLLPQTRTAGVLEGADPWGSAPEGDPFA
jgi:hypothetical protein